MLQTARALGEENIPCYSPTHPYLYHSPILNSPIFHHTADCNVFQQVPYCAGPRRRGERVLRIRALSFVAWAIYYAKVDKWWSSLWWWWWWCWWWLWPTRSGLYPSLHKQATMPIPMPMHMNKMVKSVMIVMFCCHHHYNYSNHNYCHNHYHHQKHYQAAHCRSWHQVYQATSTSSANLNTNHFRSMQTSNFNQKFGLRFLVHLNLNWVL